MAVDMTKVQGVAQKASQLSSSGAQLSSQLSSSISAQVSALQAADLKQKLAHQTLSAAQKTLDELNSAVSSLCKPLFDAIQEFKTVPPKIESIVDIQGAANGVYDKLGKMSMSM